jgi:hypothetical protein
MIYKISNTQQNHTNIHLQQNMIIVGFSAALKKQGGCCAQDGQDGQDGAGCTGWSVL